MSNQLLKLIFTQAWQIAVLAIFVAVVTRLVARNRPHLAHAMWILVLIKCVTPPIWGHSLGLFSQLQAAWMLSEDSFFLDSTVEQNIEAQEVPEDADTMVPPANEESSTSVLAFDESTSASFPGLAKEYGGDAETTATTAFNDSFVSAANDPQTSNLWNRSWPGIALIGVAIRAMITLTTMIVRCVFCLRTIFRHRTTEFDEPLRQRLQELSNKLRVRRVPRIIVSDVLFGPAVLGLVRHTIVLPRCLLPTTRSFLPERTVLGRSFLPERTFAEGEPARRACENAGLPEGTACTGRGKPRSPARQAGPTKTAPRQAGPTISRSHPCP